MSPQNQNSNKKSTTFLKTTTMIALLLGTTSLTTVDLHASMAQRALAAYYKEHNALDDSEAKALANHLVKSGIDNIYQEEQKIQEFLQAEKLELKTIARNSIDHSISFEESKIQIGVGSFDKIYDAIAAHVAAYQGHQAIAKDEDNFYAHVRVIRDCWREFDEKLITNAQSAQNVADFIARITAAANEEKKKIYSTLASVNLDHVADQEIRKDAKLINTLNLFITQENLDFIAHLRTINKPAGGIYARNDIDAAVFAKAKRVATAVGGLANITDDNWADAVAMPAGREITQENLELFAAIRGNVAIGVYQNNRANITNDVMTDVESALASLKDNGVTVANMTEEQFKDSRKLRKIDVKNTNASMTLIAAARGALIDRKEVTASLMNVALGQTQTRQDAIIAAFGADTSSIDSDEKIKGLYLIADAMAGNFNDATNADVRAYATKLVELGCNQAIKNAAQYVAYMAAVDDLVQGGTGINDVNTDDLNADVGVKIANHVTKIRGDAGVTANDVASATAIYNRLDQNLDNLTADELGIYANGPNHFLSYRLIGDAKNNYDNAAHTGAAAALRGYQESGADVFVKAIGAAGQTHFDFDKARKNFAALVAENGKAGTIANILLLTSAGLDATVDNINAADAFRGARAADEPLPVGYVDAWTQATEITDNDDHTIYDQDEVRNAIVALAADGQDFGSDDNQRIASLAIAAGDTVNNVFANQDIKDGYDFMSENGYFVDATNTAQTQQNIREIAAAYPNANNAKEQDAWAWIVGHLGDYYQKAVYGQAEITPDLQGAQALLQAHVLENRMTWGMIQSYAARQHQDVIDASVEIARNDDIRLGLVSKEIVDHLAANLPDSADILGALTAFSANGDIKGISPFLIERWVAQGGDRANIVELAAAASQNGWVEEIRQAVVDAYLVDADTTSDQMSYLVLLGYDVDIEQDHLDAATAFDDAGLDDGDDKFNANLVAAIKAYVGLGTPADKDAFLAIVNKQKDDLANAGFDFAVNGTDLIPAYTAVKAGLGDDALTATLVVRLRDTLIQDWNTTAVQINYNANPAYDVQGNADEINAALVSLLNGGVDADHLDHITAEDIAIARQIIIDNLANGAVTSGTPAENADDQVTNLGSLVAIINGRAPLEGLAGLGH